MPGEQQTLGLVGLYLRLQFLALFMLTGIVFVLRMTICLVPLPEQTK